MVTKVKVELNTKALDALPKATRDNAAELVRAVTEAAAEQIRQNTPVDEGELRDSIETYYPGPTKGVIWVDAAHGIHVEYGTSLAKAHPFIRPAIRAMKARFLGGARRVVPEK